MDLATSGAFRPQAARANTIGAIMIVLALGALGYVVWRHWIYVPSPSVVCERVEGWAQAGFERSAFEVLEAGDSKPRGTTFHDRCMWFFESMQDADHAFYGDVARCIERADDEDAALTCTYSP